MKYKIKAGSIASCIYCNDVAFVYFAEGKLPGSFVSGDAPWRALPSKVKQVIQDHFQAVFALPNEQRTEYLATSVPVELDIED